MEQINTPAISNCLAGGALAALWRRGVYLTPSRFLAVLRGEGKTKKVEILPGRDYSFLEILLTGLGAVY
jgi:hypothetical protein